MTIEFIWNGKRYECQRPDPQGPPPEHIRLLARRDTGPAVWLDLEHVAHDERRTLELYRVAKVSEQKPIGESVDEPKT